ncbi:MAG: GNAT family N-acetyltransferase [Firmicutes bacterium]|nr:GNAT family N-acetyltransferase [[Eubacterium] siraeum]MCM1488817.1 GNAT family N-acetyltransferase [Bacillota bacterium]
MIRELEARDFNKVCEIVNINWQRVYNGYINPLLLNEEGCVKRLDSLIKDFKSHRFFEYVWEENGEAAAMISIGDTEDNDKKGAFEVWRLYVHPDFQGNGIGGKLIAFAEEQARLKRYPEIVIWAFRENHNAVKFYQKQGYEPDKEKFLDEPYFAWGVRLIKRL